MSWNSRKVKLKSGGEVVVRAKYDPMKASEEDRRMVNALVGLLNEYEFPHQSSSNRVPAPPEPRRPLPMERD